jgi:hypothetical protein
VRRSLHPVIEDDRDAGEKGETLLKRRDLHEAPPSNRFIHIILFAPSVVLSSLHKLVEGDLP